MRAVLQRANINLAKVILRSWPAEQTSYSAQDYKTRWQAFPHSLALPRYPVMLPLEIDGTREVACLSLGECLHFVLELLN